MKTLIQNDPKDQKTCAEIIRQYRKHINTVTVLQMLIEREEEKIKFCLERLNKYSWNKSNSKLNQEKRL